MLENNTMVMFTETLAKQVEKAKKRNRAEAAKTVKKKTTAKKKPAAKAVTTEALVLEVAVVRKTNENEQQIIDEQLQELRDKGIESTPLRDYSKRPAKIVAVRILKNPKTVSLVESDLKMIEQLEAGIVRHKAEALMQAAQVGKLLRHIKSLIEDGEFHRWCRKTLPFCVKTAQNYMRLDLHYQELQRKGISCIVAAYAAIKGEAAPDEFIDEDDKIKPPKPEVEATVNLDDKLPKKKQLGPWENLSINEETLSIMASWETNYCRKILVVLPIDAEAEKLMGKFVLASQRVLQMGGKLIFHHPVKKIR